MYTFSNFLCSCFCLTESQFLVLGFLRGDRAGVGDEDGFNVIPGRGGYKGFSRYFNPKKVSFPSIHSLDKRIIELGSKRASDHDIGFHQTVSPTNLFLQSGVVARHSGDEGPGPVGGLVGPVRILRS